MRNFTLMLAALALVASCSKNDSDRSAVISSQPVKNPDTDTKAVSQTATPQNDQPVSSTVIVNTPDVKKDTPGEIKKSKVDWLAKLDAIQNRVEFRQRNESIWKPTELGMYFVRFDALQTQNQSAAKIVYQSGSSLDVKDNTLLIFDHDPGKKKKSEDRVIVKNGELIGSTKTELWVFTNAGLVQIKPEEQTKVAKAKISVQKDQKINVKVDTGTADVVFKGKEEFERIHVAAKSDVEITSAMKLVDNNNSVATAKLEEISTAAEKSIKPLKAELVLDQPVEGSVTKDPEITASGKLTTAGGKLLINGQLTDLKDDFSFSKKIKLQPGSNLIVFQVVRSDASVQFMRKTIRLRVDQ